MRILVLVTYSPMPLLFSDSDPLGLHSATAIRWFTALLLKCRDAFAVQLEGSLCCYVPAAPSDPLQRVAADDLGTADITMQLVR